MTYNNDSKFQGFVYATASTGPSGTVKDKPTSTLFQDGFPYGTSAAYPSAPNQNWLQNRSDSFCGLIERYGSISYLTEVDYDVGATVYNDNNGTVSIYKCNIPNGPSTTIVNPVGDASGTWTKINQWGSKGYVANTDIVSDANGNIQASNLNEDEWSSSIPYKFGQKVIMFGVGSDGKIERQIWVNVYLNPADPLIATTNLNNNPQTTSVDGVGNYIYDSEFWRRDKIRKEVLVTFLGSSDFLWREYYASGLCNQGGQFRFTTLTTPFRLMTYSELGLEDIFLPSPSVSLAFGDPSSYTITNVGSISSAGDLPVLYKNSELIATDLNMDWRTGIGVRKVSSSTITSSFCTFSCQKWLYTDKYRNV